MKSKRYTCQNCGKVRFEKFMQPYLKPYSLKRNGKSLWECVSCDASVTASKGV